MGNEWTKNYPPPSAQIVVAPTTQGLHFSCSYHGLLSQTHHEYYRWYFDVVLYHANPGDQIRTLSGCSVPVVPRACVERHELVGIVTWIISRMDKAFWTSRPGYAIQEKIQSSTMSIANQYHLLFIETENITMYTLKYILTTPRDAYYMVWLSTPFGNISSTHLGI